MVPSHPWFVMVIASRLNDSQLLMMLTHFLTIQIPPLKLSTEINPFFQFKMQYFFQPDVLMRMVHLLDSMERFKEDNKNNFYNNKCNSKSWALNNPEEHMFEKRFFFFQFCFSAKNKTKICDIFYVCLKENKTLFSILCHFKCLLCCHMY